MILKGLIFVLLLVLGVFSGVVLMIPSVMLILVHSKRVIGWRRRYVSCISGEHHKHKRSSGDATKKYLPQGNSVATRHSCRLVVTKTLFLNLTLLSY